jgi:hypothetical protein
MQYLTTYNEVEISVDENGKFHAEIAGKKRKLASLNALKKEIDLHSEATICILINRYDIHKPQKIKVVGLQKTDHNTKAILQSSEKIDLWSHILLEYSQDHWDWFMDIYEKQYALKTQWQESIEAHKDLQWQPEK